MKRCIFFLLTMAGLLYGQKPDSTLNRWIPSMVAGLNISQISFKDWTKGG